jgi:isopentenyl diphosphate isomerase/L-lactate dehydrogenase-like FMN-dependent dehydrogenase
VTPDHVNLYDFEAAAERTLPAAAWDFIAGGSMDEVTLRRNRSAYEALALRPRYLRDVSNRDLTTTMLGTEVSMPIFVSPAGMQWVAHPEGELATVRGAGAARALMIVPTGTQASIGEVAAAAAGPIWFQLYHSGRERTGTLVRAAEEAGCLAICVTCDVPVASFKERDRRHGFSVFGGEPPAERLSHQVTWDDVAWLRTVTSLPIVLKGINTAEDARLAVESGADGILVSTHGGRLMDMTLSAIESLPEVVETVGDQAEVYVDSGVRRGSDVMKALALGARAVGIGRPFYWGLAAGGADGVARVLELLRAELDIVLAYCGQTSVQSLEPNLVHVPLGWGRSAVASSLV